MILDNGPINVAFIGNQVLIYNILFLGVGWGGSYLPRLATADWGRF